MGNREQPKEQQESPLERFRREIGSLVEEARREKERYERGEAAHYNASAADIDVEELTEEDRVIWEKIQEKDAKKRITFPEFYEYSSSVEKELRDAKQQASDQESYENMKRSREVFLGLAADKAQLVIDEWLLRPDTKYK